MITRIHIKGYKSLLDVEVRLNPLGVLFGPNAAGKSNFLDALQLFSALAVSRTLRDAFAPPYRGTPLESLTFGPQGLKGLLEQDTAAFSIEADIELSPVAVERVNRQILETKRRKNGTGAPDKEAANGEPQFVCERNLRYRLEIEVRPRTGLLSVADEYLAVLDSEGKPTGGRKPLIERRGDRIHLRHEVRGHPVSYERYLNHTILSLPHYPPHCPHVVAVREELASWLIFYFEPRERMRAPCAIRETRHIGLMGEELASFLNTLRTMDERQFRGLEESVRLMVPEITGIDVGVNSLGQVELTVFEGKTPIPASLLSEGTLRILGLLALGGAKEPPALIGFEEPENGIHPRRVRLVAELLRTRAASGGTQLIVTTHSPLLADLIPSRDLLVCRRTDKATRITPFSTWGPLTKPQSVEEGLDDGELPVSQRMLRGDFDA